MLWIICCQPHYLFFKLSSITAVIMVFTMIVIPIPTLMKKVFFYTILHHFVFFFFFLLLKSITFIVNHSFPLFHYNIRGIFVERIVGLKLIAIIFSWSIMGMACIYEKIWLSIRQSSINLHFHNLWKKMANNNWYDNTTDRWCNVFIHQIRLLWNCSCIYRKIS